MAERIWSTLGERRMLRRRDLGVCILISIVEGVDKLIRQCISPQRRRINLRTGCILAPLVMCMRLTVIRTRQHGLVGVKLSRRNKCSRIAPFVQRIPRALPPVHLLH